MSSAQSSINPILSDMNSLQGGKSTQAASRSGSVRELVAHFNSLTSDGPKSEGRLISEVQRRTPESPRGGHLMDLINHGKQKIRKFNFKKVKKTKNMNFRSRSWFPDFFQILNPEEREIRIYQQEKLIEELKYFFEKNNYYFSSKDPKSEEFSTFRNSRSFESLSESTSSDENCPAISDFQNSLYPRLNMNIVVPKIPSEKVP